MTNKNSLELVWATLCSSSSIDQQTNNISLYNVLERVTFTKRKETPNQSGPQPAPIQYEYVLLLQRADPVAAKATFPLTMRLRGPKGNILSEAPIPAVFEVGKKRLRVRMQNNVLFVDGPGEYRFETLLDEKEDPIASTPLEVLVN